MSKSGSLKPSDGPEHEVSNPKRFKSTIHEFQKEHENELSVSGSVNLKVIRNVFTGSSRTGKSSLIYNLLFNKVRQHEQSTPLMEKVKVATVMKAIKKVGEGESATPWSLLSDDEFSKYIYRAQNSFETNKEMDTIINIKLGQNEKAADDGQSLLPNTGGFRDDLEGSEMDTGEVESSNAGGNIEAVVAEIIEKLGSEEEMSIQDQTFVFLLDTGGQPAFQNALPLLLDFPCNFVQVFKASRDLTAPYTNALNPDGKGDIEQDNTQSSIDLIEQSFTAAYTMSLKCSSELQVAKRPPLCLFLVGTHRNELIKLGSGKAADMEDKNAETIVSRLKNKPFERKLCSPDANQIYYLLDSHLVGTEEENEESIQMVNLLRRHLSKEEASLQLPVPKAWFVFHKLVSHYIESEKRFLWKYEDLKSLFFRVTQNATDAKFIAFLHLFRCLGFYVYHPKLTGSDSWVCTDATFFYEKVSKLLTVHYSNDCKPRDPQCRDYWESAKINVDDCTKKEFTDWLEIHPDVVPAMPWMLAMLKHFGLAASKGKLCYIPLALTAADTDLELPRKSSVANLGFTFQFSNVRDVKSYCLPTGLFHRLALDMISNRKPEEGIVFQNWEPRFSESNNRNLKFVGNCRTVFLIQKEDHFEVCLLVKKSLGDVAQICKAVMEVGQEIKRRLLYVSKKVFGKEFLEETNETSRKLSGTSSKGIASLQQGVPCQITHDPPLPDHLMVFVGREKDGKEGGCTFKEKRKDLSTLEEIWLGTIDTSKLQLEKFSYEDDTFVQLVKMEEQDCGDDPLRSVTPEEIMDFLAKKDFQDQLRECDIRGLGPDLLREGVIGIDEADSIGHNKGMKEAVDDLYIMLQRDKSTKKLKALKECLYANTTKGTHKDLADMISEFLGIAGGSLKLSDDSEQEVSNLKEVQKEHKDELSVSGSVNLKVIRNVFTGSSRTGKSSLIYTLLFNEVREDKRSTPLMEKVKVATVSKAIKKVGEGESLWRLLKDDEFSKYLYRAQNVDLSETNKEIDTIINLKQNDKAADDSQSLLPNTGGSKDDIEVSQTDTSEVESFKSSEHEMNIADTESSQNISTHTLPKTSGFKEDKKNLTTDIDNVPDKTGENDVEKDIEGSEMDTGEVESANGGGNIEAAVANIIEKLGSKEEMSIQDETFLFLLDTGGQPAFQNALPLLLDFPCSFVQVFKASRDLTAPYTNALNPDGQGDIEQDNTQSSIDLMEQSFTAAYTMSLKRSLKLQEAKLPPLCLFLVGTHRNELIKLGSSKAADMEDKNTETIVSRLKNKPYEMKLCSPEANKYYLLDSHLVGTEEENEESKRMVNLLRRHLSKEEAGLQLPVPKAWFVFHMLVSHYIETEKRFLWKYEDLKSLFVRVTQNPTDAKFIAFLHLFRCLGFYVYHPKLTGSDSWVCTDATFFYEKVSKLLTVHYSKKCEPLDPQCRYYWESAKINVDNCTNKEFTKWLEIPDVVPAMPWMLAMLEHFGLAASKEKLFHIPLALTAETAKTKLPPKSSVVNLGFTFQFLNDYHVKSYCLPTGLFHRLAVDMISNGEPAFQNWDPDFSESNNRILKFVGDCRTVFLIQQEGHFDVCLRVKKSLGDVAQTCKAVMEVGQEIKRRLSYVSKKVFGKEFLEETSETSRKSSGTSFKGIASLQQGVPCQITHDPPLPDHLMVFADNGKEGVCTFKVKRKTLLTTERIWLSNIDTSKLQLEDFPYDDDTFVQLVERSEEQHISGDDPLRRRVTPEEIKEFLAKKDFLDQLRECDIRGLGTDLLREGVIDINEADGIGHSKGMKEAADNLYMILQRDKSPKKLTALKEYLYANTTKGTHKDLADMISEFLESTGK